MGSVAFLHDFQVNSLFSKRNVVISFLWGKKNHNMRGEMIGIIRLNGGIEHNGKNIFYEDHLSTHFCSLNDVWFCSGKQIHLIKSKNQMAAARKTNTRFCCRGYRSDLSSEWKKEKFPLSLSMVLFSKSCLSCSLGFS